MAFPPYPLRKDNPRNKLSPNVRWKQKMTLTEDGKHWQIYTWFMGSSANEDKMFWHVLDDADDARHYLVHLQMPAVATSDPDDWTMLPSSHNLVLMQDHILFARAEAYLKKRQQQEEAMRRYEEARALHTLAGGNPHSFHPSTEKVVPAEEKEKCAFCGIRTENPCLSLPPDMCEQALNAAYPLGPLMGKK